MSSYYDFSGYALDNQAKPAIITAQPFPAKPMSETNMENFLQKALTALTDAFIELDLAESAQIEDDDAGEELDRSKERFVERINLLKGRIGEIQSDIGDIIYEHNHRS